MYQPEVNFGLRVELQVVIAGKMIGGSPVIRYRKVDVIECVDQFFPDGVGKGHHHADVGVLPVLV